MAQYIINECFNNADDRCPEGHVYAYTKITTGDSCCKNNVDTNGDQITLESTSCLNDESINCPYKQCIDWGKKFSRVISFHTNIIIFFLGLYFVIW